MYELRNSVCLGLITDRTTAKVQCKVEFEKARSTFEESSLFVVGNELTQGYRDGVEFEGSIEDSILVIGGDMEEVECVEQYRMLENLWENAKDRDGLLWFYPRRFKLLYYDFEENSWTS